MSVRGIGSKLVLAAASILVIAAVLEAGFEVSSNIRYRRWRASP